MFKRVIYKYHSLERIETDKNNVISAFLDNMTYCKPSNVVILKTIFHVSFNDNKYTEVYTLPVKYTGLIEKGRHLRNARQYIADVYHCSDTWGQKMTEDEMKANLEQWQQETDPEDGCPVPELYKECTRYWNELCDMYPN